MQITLQRFSLTKRHALTISRGTSAGSENLLVKVTHAGIEGWGEMAPTSGGAVSETAETAEAQIESVRALLEPLPPDSMQRISAVLETQPHGTAWKTALDCACHDWLGKRAGMPLWRLFGLDRETIPCTSVTVGINPPETIRALVPEILGRLPAQILKVKLGSPAGIEADKAQFIAAQEAANRPVAWRVDANGGWSLEGAIEMSVWLAKRGVGFIEQPLPRGQEADLPALKAHSPLPLYLDESIYRATDIPSVASCIDGVNLKIMKCGGLREAWRMIHTAQAHNLNIMFGCMSEATLAITSAAHLSSVATEVDLDSHLNLTDDPFSGAVFTEGRIIPNDLPGLGVTLRSERE
jgi:L-alanine-DL-glutamate epimerase-like enolase superfamily enzyme